METKILTEQRKENRKHFDQNLKEGFKAKGGGPQDEKKGAVGGAAGGLVGDTEEKKKKKKKKKEKVSPEVDAVPAAPKYPKHPAPPRKAGACSGGGAGGGGAHTPRTADALANAKRTPAEKAATPCMFNAYGMCRAKVCQYSHDAKHGKYSGPPPKAWLNTANKAPGAVAQIYGVAAATTLLMLAEGAESAKTAVEDLMVDPTLLCDYRDPSGGSVDHPSGGSVRTPPLRVHRQGLRGGKGKSFLSRMMSAVCNATVLASTLAPMALLPDTHFAPVSGAAAWLGGETSGRKDSKKNPCEPVKVTWLWDSAAGRNLFGKDLLPAATYNKIVRKSPNPVNFSTGGGHQPGADSFAFSNGQTAGEETYVLNKSPAARAIGIAVQTKKRLFLWDPRGEELPYFVMTENLSKISLNIPDEYKVYADRVVENVPQSDELLYPTWYEGVKDPVYLPVPAMPIHPDNEELHWAACDVEDPTSTSSTSKSPKRSSDPPAKSLADRVATSTGNEVEDDSKSKEPADESLLSRDSAETKEKFEKVEPAAVPEPPAPHPAERAPKTQTEEERLRAEATLPKH